MHLDTIPSSTQLLDITIQVQKIQNWEVFSRSQWKTLG